MAESPSRQLTSVDLGTSGGEWTFQQDGMVFGPLPARVVVEKLYSGELSGLTPVSGDGEGFRPLHEISFFALHLAKAEAKLRVQRDADRFLAGERRGRRMRWSIGLTLLGLSLAGAIGGVTAILRVRHRELQREIDEIPITANPPELSLAEPAATEAEIAVPTDEPRRPHKAHEVVGHPQSDGVSVVHYDKNSIIAAEIHQKSLLIPCIKQELTRVPGFRGDIRFSLAVGNDGRVVKLWMDEPQFKDGPLQGCFSHVMEGWRFASYEGERATLTDSFRVGR